MEDGTSLNFKFINFGSELEINIDDNNQAQCPKCQKRFKQLLQHLKKSIACRSNIDLENFRIEYQSFTNRRKQNVCRQKKLETNNDETHKYEAKKKKQEREKKLNIDAEGTHKYEAKKKKEERGRKVNIDSKETHKNEALKKKGPEEKKAN